MIQPTPQGIPNYASCQRKTFHSALGHFLQTEFPTTFGPAVTQLFAERVDALYEQFHPPRSRLTFGQVVWVAVAASHRPAGDNRIENLPLVPLVLDLVTSQDIDDTMTPNQRLPVRSRKIVRLFRQAFEQGGVLSQADVSLLLHVSRPVVAQALDDHQQKTGETLPPAARSTTSVPPSAIKPSFATSASSRRKKPARSPKKRFIHPGR